MTRSIVKPIVHPAYPRLLTEIAAQRRALAHALAIEADWRFHDGPEWAARYYRVFGDLRRDADHAPDMRLASVQAETRSQWPALSAIENDQARAIFRLLLARLHPAVAPDAAAADIDGLWARILRAYRSGDIGALRGLRDKAMAQGGPAWRAGGVIAARQESARLARARATVDRRLAELSQQFPFCLRDRLDDPDWCRRQRLALGQAIAFTRQPRRRRTKTTPRRVS